MDYLPIFLKLQDQPCLIVGGGDIAVRKLRLLAAAGAKLTVVAPTLCAEMAELAESGTITYLNHHFAPEHVNGMRLVIAATNQETVNAQVYASAEAARIPVNVVDDAARCRFIMPAIIDRSPLMIAVSTGGGVPVLARRVRAELERTIPARYGDLAKLASQFRETAKATFPDTDTRRFFWEQVLDGPIPQQVFAGDLPAAEAALRAAFAHANPKDYQQGAVYLVGSGPGNPDLLTFRALKLMQLADIVLYDNLVAPEILDLVRRDAERLFVGKQRDNHAIPQETLNQKMVELAQAGKKVLRLKGGDPFIFGRGGEEIDTLAAHGIPFEVVPGITSAAGASCLAGIPLTHRDYAQSCTFVTGHRKAGATEFEWARHCRQGDTLVIYMGLAQAAEIRQQLLAAGRGADTPVAIIERASQANQRVITGTLAALDALITEHDVHSPAIILVGEVVLLREKLRGHAAHLA